MTDKELIDWGEWFLNERVKWAYGNNCKAAPIPSDILLKQYQKLNNINDKIDWEIVSFEWNGMTYDLFDWQKWRCYSEPTFATEGGSQLSLSFGLKAPEIKIESVRRISDNTVWSVDERSKYKIQNESYTIKRFEIIDGKMMCWLNGMYIPISLNSLEKLNPLFITEDGKAIYYGDEYWIVRLSDLGMCKWVAQYALDNSNKKFFSIESAAKEYIAKHKPKQPIKPFVVFTKPSYGNNMFFPYNFGSAKVDADENSYQRFETNDEALTFCIERNPCLSLIDVKGATGIWIKYTEIEEQLKQLVEEKIKSL